jgi:hypothetical protein
VVLEAEEAEAAILIALHPVSAEGEEAALFFGKFQSELSQSSGEHPHEGFGFIAVLKRADEVIGITHDFFRYARRIFHDALLWLERNFPGSFLRSHQKFPRRGFSGGM